VHAFARGQTRVCGSTRSAARSKMSVEQQRALAALRADLAPAPADHARVFAALEARIAAASPRHGARANRPAGAGRTLFVIKLGGLVAVFCATAALFGWTARRATHAVVPPAPARLEAPEAIAAHAQPVPRLQVSAKAVTPAPLESP